MTLKLEKYDPTHRTALKDLPFEDVFVREDILGCLEEFPSCAIVARSGESIAAVGVYTGVSEKTSLNFYVHPAYRCQGIGSLLLRALEIPSSPSISAYLDSDYPSVQKILSESFHRMRLHVGLRSSLSAPSEEERFSFLNKTDDIFVLCSENEILAVAMVEGNEIDKIAVVV